MSKARIREIVTLTREGWRPYDAEPDHSVYERLGCTHVLRGNRRKPFWFVRGDVFCCIGLRGSLHAETSGGLSPSAAHTLFQHTFRTALFSDAAGNGQPVTTY